MEGDEGEAEATASAAAKEKDGERCPDFEPPQAVVNRIMKGVLPDNVQVTKDARTAFSRASGVFIFYLTHCANDISKEKKRSTIYAQDVLTALNELDYEDFRKPVEDFLQDYRSEQEKKKQRKSTDTAAGDDNEMKPADAIEGERDDDDEDIEDEGEDEAEPEDDEPEASAANAEEEE